MGVAGKDLKALTLFIRVNITVTLQLLTSLSLVSGNTLRVRVLLGPAGRITISSLLCVCFCLLEALPTCVIVWPLSACLLQSAVLQQPSPPPFISLVCALPPCGPLQDWLPSSSSSPPGPPGQEQLFQNWPTCIESTTATPESVLSKPPLPLSLSLSCKDYFS